MSSRPLALTKIVKPTSRARQEQEVEAATSVDDAVAGDEVAGEMHAEGVRKRKVKRYHNHDIPGYPHTLKKFRDHLLPCWYYYVATLNNPWELVHPEHVASAQSLWNKYVRVDHEVALQDEPVFALVSPDGVPFVIYHLFYSSSSNEHVNGERKLPSELFLPSNISSIHMRN